LFQTALHFCARNGNVDCARCLLQHSVQETGANAEQAANGCLTRDHAGRTPLLVALAHQQLEVALLLLRHSPCVLHFCDNNGVAPLHIAASLGLTGFVSTLIRTCEEASLRDVLDRGSVEEMSTPQLKESKANAMANAMATVPIHQAPWLHQHMEKFKTTGYPLPSKKDYRQHMRSTMFAHHPSFTYSTPPLHVAIRAGHFHVVQLLLEEGADPSVVDTEAPVAMPVQDPRSALGLNAGGSMAAKAAGRSALDVAAALGQVHTMCTLLDYGAHAQQEKDLSNGHIMLLRSCHELHHEVAEVLLDLKLNPNQASKVSWTPIGNAAYSFWTPLSATFGFARKVKLSKRDRVCQLAVSGTVYSPVIPSLLEQWLATFLTELLVQHGADVNWTDERAWSYMHHAAHEVDHAIVQFLLESRSFVPPWETESPIMCPLMMMLGRAGSDLAYVLCYVTTPISHQSPKRNDQLSKTKQNKTRPPPNCTVCAPVTTVILLPVSN
jgi:ankyrin repeat protein